MKQTLDHLLYVVAHYEHTFQRPWCYHGIRQMFLPHSESYNTFSSLYRDTLLSRSLSREDIRRCFVANNLKYRNTWNRREQVAHLLSHNIVNYMPWYIQRYYPEVTISTPVNLMIGDSAVGVIK